MASAMARSNAAVMIGANVYMHGEIDHKSKQLFMTYQTPWVVRWVPCVFHQPR